MSDERDTTVEPTDPDHRSDPKDDRGIETTTGEPNTFEPEEDPDAAVDGG